VNVGDMIRTFFPFCRFGLRTSKADRGGRKTDRTGDVNRSMLGPPLETVW
jgi:hypothetical protein